MIAALTTPHHAATITPVVATAATGIRTLNNNTGDKTPLPLVAFLCLPFKAALCCLFVMAGCNGQPQGWPVPVSGSANPLHSAAQKFAPLTGGYSHFNTGISAMNTQTTGEICPNSPEYTDLQDAFLEVCHVYSLVRTRHQEAKRFEREALLSCLISDSEKLASIARGLKALTVEGV